MKKIEKLLTIGLAGLITFGMLAGCGSIENSSSNSQSTSSCEHTYELVGFEGGHQTVYTCGCPTPDIAELHSDDDGDYKCDVCGWSIEDIKPDEPQGTVQLRNILQKLPFEYNVDGLIEKYHFYADEGLVAVLFDNSEDYCAFLSDISVPYEGPFDFLFEEKVMFCYLRCVSGSADFIPVEYFYHAEVNEIECKTIYQPEPDVNFPAVEICWCVDLVEVPKNIFEQLNKN